MGRLTTHVLDTSRGRPAGGLRVELYALDGGRRLLNSMTTNDDGRLPSPLAENETFRAGTYELLFHTGDYFRRNDVAISLPPFLDEVPVRFTVADATQHYHVPLLLSPFAYSTYRGS